MVEREAAPGIHRIEDAYTNWYLVEADGRLTVVDAGVRGESWSSLLVALAAIGRRPEDIDALILTHAHFDHIGIAEHLRARLGVPVYVHENDWPLTKQPRMFARERKRVWYYGTQFQALPIVAALLKARAFWPPRIREVRRFVDGPLDVPGSPQVAFTPGHTLGHVSFHFPDRDTVIAGDAAVMLDPYTNMPGPRLVSRAATADVARNLDSLDALAATGARTVLTGHGEPWREGVEAFVERARLAPVT